MTKERILKFAALQTVAVTTAFFQGCGSGPASSSTQAPEPTSATQTRTAEPTPPVKIAVLQDKSGSTKTTRTQQLEINELDLLINLIRKSGGEIGFGLIRDNSNRSLVRLRLEIPPAEPKKPSDKGNAFTVAKAKAAFGKDLADYQVKLAEWEYQSENRIQAFKNEIMPPLKQQANARRTDIWGAVLRADLFLSETDTGWSQPPRRYAVLISDGIHTASSKFTPMKSAAKVIMVNGSASLGGLEKLRPIRFESTEAAFRFIAAEQRGR